jgi:hypothetical protein
MPSKEPFPRHQPRKRGGGLNSLCPPKNPGKRAPLGKGHSTDGGGRLPPLLPGGVAGMKKRKGMNRYVLLGVLLVLTMFSPVSAVDGSGIGAQLANAIRSIVLEIVAILTPIIAVIGVGMIIIGLLLGLGLRQEYLGLRLAIGGALALATVYLIVPLLLGFI